VDEVLALDEDFRKAAHKGDTLRKEMTLLSKQIGELKKVRTFPVDTHFKNIFEHLCIPFLPLSFSPSLSPQAGQDASELTAKVLEVKAAVAVAEADLAQVETARDRKLNMIGNIVMHDVPVSNDEANNVIVRTNGECKPNTGKLYHHHELLHMIDGYASQQGVTVAGHRAYFLKGVGVMFNQALINYGLNFLMQKKYTPLQVNSFLKFFLCVLSLFSSLFVCV
jgi:seryl-tRNA synthetase